jgi:AcrR family transcriptional regulator
MTRGAGLKAGLDSRAVVLAAAHIADEQGLDAVTLAAVAERLDVKVPSLYSHVEGLAGLRRDLALEGTRRLGGALARAAIGRSGDEAVRAMAGAYRAFVKEHPGLYAATVRAPDPGDRELQEAAAQIVDVVLQVVSVYGLHEDEALHAVRGLRSLAHGFATLEAAGGFGLPLDLDASFSRLVEAYIRGLRSATDRQA